MFLKKYYPQGKFELYGAKNQFLWGSSFDLDQWFFYEYDNKGIKKQDIFGIQIRGCVEISLSPHLMRGRKRTDLINQIFIGPVLMRSRAGRGNRIVSRHPHKCEDKHGGSTEASTGTNPFLHLMRDHKEAGGIGHP